MSFVHAALLFMILAALAAPASAGEGGAGQGAGEDGAGQGAGKDGAGEDAGMDRDAPAGTAVIHFGEEESLVEVLVGPDLQPVPRESLLRKRYRGPDPAGVTHEAPPRPAALVIGIRAGVSLAMLGGDGAGSDTARVGGVAGAFLAYGVSDRLIIQPGLELSARGAVPDGAGGQARLSYVAVPVLARFLAPIAGVELSAGLGPSLGFALRARAGDAAIARMDLGAIVCLGVARAASAGGLALDARYEHGLADVIAAGSAGQHGAVQNRVLSLAVAYTF